MRLVADRFAIDGEGRAWDLATGMRVTLIVQSAGGVSDQMRWTVRCDRLHKLQQRAMASLVDFGIVGETSRFEAWRCGGLYRDGSAGRLEPAVGDEAARVRELAKQFLRALGYSTGLGDADRMHVCRGGAVWVPDAEAGYALDGEPTPDAIPLANRGMAIVDRPAVSALAEIFHNEGGPRPDVTALWGPPGAGKTMAVRELARIARLRGFVPVASRLVDSPLADLWQGRSLFIIDDDSGGAPWSALLQSAMRTSQPHVLLLVGRHEVPAVEGVALGRIGADALASAVCPPAPDGSIEPSILQAAERARGLPGRFAQLLWAGSATEPRRRRLATLGAVLVAEQPAIYGPEERIPSTTAIPLSRSTCSARYG
jgi:hypothetical protein